MTSIYVSIIILAILVLFNCFAICVLAVGLYNLITRVDSLQEWIEIFHNIKFDDINKLCEKLKETDNEGLSS